MWERRRARERIIRLLEEYSWELAGRLGRVTVILYGSYARGDFNVWSDIDLVIVSEAFSGVRPLERWKLLPDPPQGLDGLEPILWTPDEAATMLRKPAWRLALKGCITVRDDYGLRVCG